MSLVGVNVYVHFEAHPPPTILKGERTVLEYLAYGLTILLALGIIVIGLRFFLAPHSAAAGYGVAIDRDGARAYLTIKGLRDLTYGVLGLVLLAVAGPHVTGWFMAVTAIVPVGDTLIVLRNGGTKAAAFGIHFTTAAAMLVASALLFGV
jgi:hypothetical protein